jgi:hypothetical protein
VRTEIGAFGKMLAQQPIQPNRAYTQATEHVRIREGAPKILIALPPTDAKEIARFLMTTGRALWLFNLNSHDLYLVS